ncbi:hypothetical protein HZ326_20025 [Fusarium oxysporum f. sp. albedinis]|nr:hypothetical protein HZ326_20025 [Fusarium oxysporum f. sp. albedinis]
MIPKIASSCNPRTMHPWGNPSQGKNPRRPERCSVDEAIAPFHGLQAMFRARGAQCRWRHLSQRKVNSLIPFLQAAVRVPLSPQLSSLPF